MSKEYKLDGFESNSIVNRRQLLKQLGVAGTSIAIGSTVISNPVVADQGEVEKVTGKKELELIQKAKSLGSYSTLLNNVRNDGVEIQSLTENAYEIVNGDGSSFYMVSFINDERNNGPSVNIGIPIGSDIFPKAIITEYDDNRPKHIVTYSIKDNGVVKKEHDVPYNIEDSNSTEEDAGISPAYDPPTSCDGDQVVSCSTCKTAMSAINVTTCGLETAVACAYLTSAIGPVGPLSCPVLVGLACWAYHDMGVSNPYEICEMGCFCS